MLHHEPDITIVPCVACGELVDKIDLIPGSNRFTRSCCLFHPFHHWCYRHAPPAPRSWTACADCGGQLAFSDVRDAARWLAGLDARLHVDRVRTGKSWVGPPHELATPRPPATRFVRVNTRGRDERATETLFLGGTERDAHERLGGFFEIVHGRGCDGELPIVAQLRDSPEDIALRLVYGDALEEAGEAERAAFVRDDIAKRRGEPHVGHDDPTLDSSLPSAWREAVARRVARRG